MSAKFCMLIPSKVLQIDKHFLDKLKIWLSKYKDKQSYDDGLLSYSWLTLPEFLQQPDVNANLPEKIYHRYHVIDWDFYFPPPDMIKDFLFWLANIYIYGEAGLLKYWSDQLQRFPPITMGETQINLSHLSVADLPLDHLLLFPLQQFYETP